MTFSLDAGFPAGASITTGGFFTWTPPVGHNPATNPVTVRVTDNGAPALFATRTFNIVVVRAPRILSVAITSGTNVTLQWESFAGKTYRVQSKDDLAAGSWNSLGNDVPATGPVSTANDTMGVSQQRYYRVLLLD